MVNGQEMPTEVPEGLKRYEIELTLLKKKTVTLDAESPEAAATTAEAAGFKADDVTEVIDGVPAGEYWEVTGRCEGCSQVLLDNAGEVTADDVDLCKKCFDEMVKAEENPDGNKS